MITSDFETKVWINIPHLSRKKICSSDAYQNTIYPKIKIPVTKYIGTKKLIEKAAATKKITSRTTGAKGNKFLQVITSFNCRKIESNRYQVTNQN